MICYARTGRVELALAMQAKCVAPHGETPRGAASEPKAISDAHRLKTPFVSVATLRLADVLDEVGRFPEAGRLYASLTVKPDEEKFVADGLSGLGWCHFRTGQLSLANDTFARLLKSFPQHSLAPEAALAQAQILEQLDQPLRSLAAYERVIDRYGDGRGLSFALLAAAQIHDELGNNGKAANYYRRLLAEFPDHPQQDTVLYQLAWALNDDKQIEAALSAFQRLHEEHPTSQFWDDATYHLANAAFSAERFDQAEQLTAKLLAKNP